MKSFNNKQLQKSKQARAAHSLVHFAAVSSQRPGGGGGGGEGLLLGILDGGVPPASPNPDPISDQKFFTPVFSPGL